MPLMYPLMSDLNFTPSSTAWASVAAASAGVALALQIEHGHVCVAVAPVPESDNVVGVFEALLATDTLPDTVPAAVGANFTWKVALCPAATVIGNVRPLTLYPAPVTFACEMVTLAVLAVRVTVFDTLLPTFTLPKLREVGLAASVPTAAAPLPWSCTAAVGFVASLVNATLPLAVPELWGANVIEKVVDWPGDSVTGRTSPLALKPAPIAVACVIVSDPAPSLLKLTDCVWLEPIVTVPKSTAEGVVTRWPWLLLCVPVNS
jgi:hypothetical protein